MKRAAVVAWYPPHAAQEWRDTVKAVHASLSKKGNTRVDLVLVPASEMPRITGADLLLFGYPVEKWFPKSLDSQWVDFLAKCGHVAGKRVYAFCGTGSWGSEKTLVLLMNSLEREGMIVRDFGFLRNTQDADAFTSRLKLTE